ncbi:hypothetical protein KI387_039796, partial [Taxus chinensis]
MDESTRTLVLVNLAGIMEKADEALLPGVYREVGLALHASPTGLGSLTLLRSLTQAACFPVAAYLAVHHNRAHVIALGAFLWAAATFLVGISKTFLQVPTFFFPSLSGLKPAFTLKVLFLGGQRFWCIKCLINIHCLTIIINVG